MNKLVIVLLMGGLIAMSIPGRSSAVDFSRSILLDIPPEKAEEQFGKLPPSQLTPEELAQMSSYRFTADTLKVLVILVDWVNRPHTYPMSVFDRLIFSRDFLPDGSVADYFHEASYGQAYIDGEVVDWVNAGLYSGWFWFEDLLAYLDPVIDYSQFDGDGNGDVDAVTFVRSGTGEEDSQDPNDIWSYAIGYPEGEGPGPFDGVYVSKWNTSPEMRPLRDPENPQNFSGVDTLNRIRVFCHELAHNFGIPDLYDYDDKLVTSTYYTPDDDNDHPYMDWCLMGYYGYGLFSLGTDIAVHLSGWCKKEIGWISPVVLDPGTYDPLVVHNLETTPDSSLYMLPIDLEEGEYFLLEYRNRNSAGMFDKVDSDFSVYFWPDLTYGCDPLDRGLLITHVHDSLGADYFRINSGTPDLPHYTVAVEDAGYNPAQDAWSNPEGFVTDSAHWWYPYETRKEASFSDDVPGQQVFSPTTYPNSNGYYRPTGIVVQVDSIVDDRLYAFVHLPPPFQLGDTNGDETVDVGDVVYLVNYLYRGGDAPDPVEAGDANCDANVDVGDVVTLVNYLYRGGDPPGC